MKQKIIDEANYYLENNFTIEQAANNLGIPKSTLQKHIKKLEDINIELYIKVRNKQEENQQLGRVKGGTIGKRTSKWSEEDINRFVDLIISNDYTLEELSNYIGIPKSTLYELVTSSIVPIEKKTLIEALFVAHKKGMTLEEVSNLNRRK